MMWFGLGSALMFLGVALGAFAGHALKSALSLESRSIFEIAVRYHIYHALALLAVGWFTERHPQPLANAAGWAFTAGVVLFSGSLYLFSLTGNRWWGAVTPIGGLSFMTGWACLAVAAFRS